VGRATKLLAVEVFSGVLVAGVPAAYACQCSKVDGTLSMVGQWHLNLCRDSTHHNLLWQKRQRIITDIERGVFERFLSILDWMYDLATLTKENYLRRHPAWSLQYAKVMSSD
jgi:hypothetical protein